MSYVILVCEDNSLYGSHKEKIMQREKLFNELWFLVEPDYNGYNMSQCTVTMRYLLPISKEFKTETLVLSDETYEQYLKYTLPIDTELTKECGNIELNLTFTLLDADDDGNAVQRVRKTDDYILKITQIPDWDSVIPDSALSALDQRILKLDAQTKALEAYAEILDQNQVNNLSYDNESGDLQLMSDDKEIGDKVTIKSCTCDPIEDGVPVVDFGNEDTTPSEEDNVSDVIEF